VKTVHGLTYPAVMALTVGAALFAVHLGAPAPWVAALGSLLGAGVIVLLERLTPYLPDWNRSRGDVAVDLLHLVFSTTPVPVLVRAAGFGVLAVVAAKLSASVGFALWPHQTPLILQLALALVVAELGQYWVHRMGHTFRPLWRLHAMHHSVGRLYWLNAGRFHPLDTLLQYTSEVAPLVLLGADENVLALYTVFTATNGGLRHSNIQMRLGGWNRIFSTADMHRWHHSQVVDEANANYGANLILWDVVFGTRALPANRAHPEALGLHEMPEFPTTYLGQLGSPFVLERYEQPDRSK
jgi:ornithine lipid hydroxylase